jgi:glycosyltransferase involved in cell wall biosynthesis
MMYLSTAAPSLPNPSEDSVSIALCTFNGAKYLREQLDSLASQTLLPAELVICDDQSVDESRRLLESFSRKAPFPVRLTENVERLGATCNFEKAIRLCRGDLIFLADQDDIWAPEKLRVLVGTLQRYPDAAYAFCDADVIDSEGRPIGTSLWEMNGLVPRELQTAFRSQQVALLLKRNIVAGCTLAFRASLKELVLPIPKRWVHDYWIASVGSVFAYGVAVPDRLLRYRKHASQHIGMESATIWSRIRESLRTEKKDYWERLAAARDIEDRVRHLSKTRVCPQGYLDEIEKITLHLAHRAASQEASGLTKVRIVMEEVASGRYGRFSGSWRSVVRDLCPQFLLG